MSGISYQLTVLDLVGHTVEVQLHFTPTGAGNTILSLPAWIPGSYMIRDYAKHLNQLQASDSLGALALKQLDKQSWQLQHRHLAVTVRYQLYCYDISVRGNYLDDQLAALNPCALCLCVSGFSETSHQLQVTVPHRPDWQVATGLKPGQSTEFMRQGLYLADNYQQLIDSPLLLGRLSHRQFEIAGIVHHIVLAGHRCADLDRLQHDLLAICQQQVAVFGALPQDLENYWFLCWLTDKGYGGLEHLNSTLLLASHQDLANPQRPDESTDSYRTFLGLCSHEYFHTWWVKRAKPSQYLHYQLDQEQYSTQLWLYEGFTSYFDDLALLRAGRVTPEQYLCTLEQSINRVQLAPSELAQSLTESSFNAWTKYYKQDENACNTVVSYYAKGSLIALCLQARLQQLGLTLESVMQHAWSAFAVSGMGSHEQGFIELVRGYAGSSLADELKTWVEQAQSLPLAELLPLLGLSVDYRPQHHPKDWSGPAAHRYPVPAFGASYTASAEGLLIQQVQQGSAAYQAGLMVHDQIIAIDGVKATESNFQAVLSQTSIGSNINLHLFRRQRLVCLPFTLTLAPANLVMLRQNEPSLLQAWWRLTPVNAE